MADPDLQIREGGGGHPDPEIRGGGQSPKIFFSALRASFWSINKAGGGGGWARTPHLDPPMQTVKSLIISSRVRNLEN